MRNLPLVVTSRLSNFSESEKRAYFEEFDRKKKSVFVAYLLLIPLGWHYAYLRKWGLQALCIVSLWGLLIWWIIDWFRVPSLVRNFNKDLSIELLNNFAWVSKKEIPEMKERANIIQSKKEISGMSLNDYYRLKNK